MITEVYSYNKLSFEASKDGDEININKSAAESNVQSDNALGISVISLYGYNCLTGNDVELKKDEILMYCVGVNFGKKAEIMGKTYDIIKIDAFPEQVQYNNLQSAWCGIVTDNDTFDELDVEYQKSGGNNFAMGYMYINLDGTDNEKIEYYQEFNERVNNNDNKSDEIEFLSINSKQLLGQGEIYSFYGAFFFLGMFLGIVFIFATALIIYYKQLSEGYDDRHRFEIMQKVGMTEFEVKQTIRSQVLIVFFLPLAVSAVHIAFAFPMIKRILTALGMTNTALFAICTVLTFVGFTIVYLLIYMQTAKTYYNIVRR